MQVIKTALLSFGMSGKVFHAPFLNLHKGFELLGSWERSQQNIQQIYPGTISYPSLEKLLADDKIQLVVVNTPNSTHYNYTKAALVAGKDVVVEKAFTTTVDEAMDLKILAKKMGRKISVFQSRRWTSEFKTAQKILKQNKLGDIVEAEIHYERYRPAISPKLHKELPHPGAGLLYDLGPHLVDQAVCLFGLPKSIFADIRITRPGSQVDDWFDIVLYYPTFRVRLKAGFFVREKLPGFILHGTKGSFIKSMADVQEANLMAGITPATNDWGTEPEEERGILHTEIGGVITREKITSERGNYGAYYEGVYEAITEDKPMPVTVDEGILVMKILETAVKSNDVKKVIDL